MNKEAIGRTIREYVVQPINILKKISVRPVPEYAKNLFLGGASTAIGIDLLASDDGIIVRSMSIAAIVIGTALIIESTTNFTSRIRADRRRRNTSVEINRSK